MKNQLYAICILTVLSLATRVPVNAADPCDRACLENHIDMVLAAMIAYNPSQLMLANDVRYTENGVELRLGDVMGDTLSARGKYNLHVCDPESGTDAFLSLTEKGDR